MKALMAATFVLITSASVQAANFDHPCEVVYYEINKKESTSGYTMEDLLTCKEQFGTTKLIKKAEAYKKSIADRLEEVEKRIKESEAAARGERAGKIIRTFDLDQMTNHRSNILRVPFTSYVHLTKKDKEYETSADKVCEKLGFESAVSSSQSETIAARSMSEIQNAPERVLEMRPGGFFRSAKDIVHTINKKRPSKNDWMEFRYFTEISCERTLKEGEVAQDFEIDIEAIRRQVEKDIAAPELDRDVRAILSIGRSESERRVGEDQGERLMGDDDSWRPSYDKDNFFIVVPE